jgi:hypothetical protein
LRGVQRNLLLISHEQECRRKFIGGIFVVPERKTPLAHQTVTQFMEINEHEGIHHPFCLQLLQQFGAQSDIRIGEGIDHTAVPDRGLEVGKNEDLLQLRIDRLQRLLQLLRLLRALGQNRVEMECDVTR